MPKVKTVAVIGGGIGGICAAIALRSIGVEAIVFEQASQFRRIGAAINMTPNAVKVLDGLGVGEAVRDAAHIPGYRVSRTWQTGAETSRVELGNAAIEKFDAPVLLLHRADLLTALEASVPADAVRLNHELIGLEQGGEGVELTFANGSTFRAEAVIGADGIHSAVRRELFGPEEPISTGMSAYRAVFPVERVAGLDTEDFVKWWGPTPKVQIVTFRISRGEELFVFATMPDEIGDKETWSGEGDLAVLRAQFADFHADARQLLEACDGVLRTGLYERAPLDSWSRGRVALLGDACHAMVPFMAQGAAMGLEDAAILARCIAANDDWSIAVSQYERTRIPRASKIQLGSHENEWLRNAGNPEWVYGFDAWKAPLD